jgi:hypothetical protein
MLQIPGTRAALFHRHQKHANPGTIQPSYVLSAPFTCKLTFLLLLCCPFRVSALCLLPPPNRRWRHRIVVRSMPLLPLYALALEVDSVPCAAGAAAAIELAAV